MVRDRGQPRRQLAVHKTSRHHTNRPNIINTKVKETHLTKAVEPTKQFRRNEAFEGCKLNNTASINAGTCGASAVGDSLATRANAISDTTCECDCGSAVRSRRDKCAAYARGEEDATDESNDESASRAIIRSAGVPSTSASVSYTHLTLPTILRV